MSEFAQRTLPKFMKEMAAANPKSMNTVREIIASNRYAIPYGAEISSHGNTLVFSGLEGVGVFGLGGARGVVFVKNASKGAFDILEFESVAPAAIGIYVHPHTGGDVNPVSETVGRLEIDETNLSEKLSSITFRVEYYTVFGGYDRSVGIGNSCLIRRFKGEHFMFIPFKRKGNFIYEYIKVAKVRYLKRDHVVNDSALKTVPVNDLVSFDVIDGWAHLRFNDCRITFKVKPQIYYAQYYADCRAYLSQKISNFHERINAFFGKFFKPKSQRKGN